MNPESLRFANTMVVNFKKKRCDPAAGFSAKLSSTPAGMPQLQNVGIYLKFKLVRTCSGKCLCWVNEIRKAFDGFGTHRGLMPAVSCW